MLQNHPRSWRAISCQVPRRGQMNLPPALTTSPNGVSPSQRFPLAAYICCQLSCFLFFSLLFCRLAIYTFFYHLRIRSVALITSSPNILHVCPLAGVQDSRLRLQQSRAAARTHLVKTLIQPPFSDLAMNLEYLEEAILQQ